MKKLGLFAILFFGLLFLGGNASACGCGMALAPSAVFNSLKESNAFLVADVQEDGSYYLKPYFRFVSLDEPYNVTMVFPLKALPKGFDAKKLTQKEFFEQEGIDLYEKLKDSQSWSGFAKRFSDNNKPFFFLYAIGFVGPIAVGILSIPILLFGFTGSVGMAGSESLLAHYSFEGGSLDIYNASAEGTLGELVARTGFKPEGKLAELVEKYKNHYVAVLDLEVPTALPKNRMDYFKNNCPFFYEKSKEELKKSNEIDLRKIGAGSSGYYPPRSIDVDALPQNFTTVSVFWQTDIPSDSRVYFGNAGNEKFEPYVTNHALDLFGRFSPNTTYTYKISSCNQGACSWSALRQFVFFETTLNQIPFATPVSPEATPAARHAPLIYNLSISTTTNPIEPDGRICNDLAGMFVLNAIGKERSTQYAKGGTTPPKGVLLELKFAPEDTLFYPVSIVESYNYPVSQQQYFVKTPLGKEFSFTSSYAAQTAIVNETRWMEVKNTNQDIEGIIGNAGLVTQANDASLRILNALYENAFFASLLVYLASIFTAWKLLEKSPAEQKPPFWHFLAGGAVLLAYELWKKDEKTAKIMFAGIIVWLILALMQ